MDDLQLLYQYVEKKNESAFAELVDRHIDLVYSTCMRRLRNRQDAEDATQAVFIVLASKAKTIRSNTVLAAWLYRTARWAAASAARNKLTRSRHETTATRMIESPPHVPSVDQYDLDAALARLRAADRQVVLLRYFKERSFEEVAREMRLTEQAARKRLNRAIARLRQVLRASGEPALSVAVVENVIRVGLHHAPPALRAAAAAQASGAAASAAGVSIAKGAMILMAISKAKTAMVTAFILVLLLGGGTFLTWNVFQSHRNKVVILPATDPAGGPPIFSLPATRPSGVADDAWPLIDKAAAIIAEGDHLGMSSPAASAFAFTDHPPFPPQWHNLARQAYDHNLPALTLMREARSMTVAHWPRATYDNQDVRDLQHVRNIANEIADAATYQHVFGNDAQAIEFIRDDLHLADLVDSGDGVRLVDAQMAAGVRATTLHRLEVISTDVSLTTDPSDRRHLQVSSARELIRQIFTNDDPATHLGEIFAREDQSARSTKADESARTSLRRTQMERNLAAMSLACHLYRFEKSRWPASLEDLLPFLPAAPVDAWGAMGYTLIASGLPDGNARPLVYSRCMSKDGLFYPTDYPRYGLYRGDGSHLPADQQKEGGQFRDVALWAPGNKRAGPATRPLG